MGLGRSFPARGHAGLPGQEAPGPRISNSQGMELRRFLAALALGSCLLGAPAQAQPAPPIVFDAEGHGTVRDPAAVDLLRDRQYLPGQSQLETLHGIPWWWRPAWEYDEAGLYLFGDPYAGRRSWETLGRVRWPGYPGWCLP